MGALLDGPGARAKGVSASSARIVGWRVHGLVISRVLSKVSKEERPANSLGRRLGSRVVIHLRKQRKRQLRLVSLVGTASDGAVTIPAKLRLPATYVSRLVAEASA